MYCTFHVVRCGDEYTQFIGMVHPGLDIAVHIHLRSSTASALREEEGRRRRKETEEEGRTEEEEDGGGRKDGRRRREGYDGRVRGMRTEEGREERKEEEGRCKYANDSMTLTITTHTPHTNPPQITYM